MSIELKEETLDQPTQDLQTEVEHRFTFDREVIPIIFVPGIMGSRLRKAGKGVLVWDPDDKPFMFNTYGWRSVGPEEKKAIIIGPSFKESYLEVANDDASHNLGTFFFLVEGHGYIARYDLSIEEIKWRGWGGVSWDFYGPAIEALHQSTKLKEPDVELPVYAFGYNWTASNRTSGEKLKQRIDAIIKHYKDKGRQCRQVILITHSMGGLVGRAACILSGAAPNVLGVIHGAQPVLGAPAAYWRMRAGMERRSKWLPDPTAWVVGTDGKEISAVLGSMPGGLELLPNQNYKAPASDPHRSGGSPQWLTVVDHRGVVHLALPNGDPYKDIYSVPERYWSPNDSCFLDSATFVSMLEGAKKFHQELGLKQHAETYNIYIDGGDTKTIDVCTYRLQPYVWTIKQVFDPHMGIVNVLSKEKPKSPEAFGDQSSLRKLLLGEDLPADNEIVKELLRRNDFKGEFMKFISFGKDKALEIKLELSEGRGDGTVPSASGRALQDHGQPSQKGGATFENISHDAVYKRKPVIEKTIDFIIAICGTRKG